MRRILTELFKLIKVLSMVLKVTVEHEAVLEGNNDKNKKVTKNFKAR